MNTLKDIVCMCVGGRERESEREQSSRAPRLHLGAILGDCWPQCDSVWMYTVLL